MITKKDINKLDGLLYLYALSKTNSKRSVAEKLGTSVDTINKYISDLEQETKTIFLVSNGRGTTITPEGERILRTSEDIVRALHSINDYADTAASCAGIVRIGTTDAIAGYLGNEGLAGLMAQYPDLYIETHISNQIPDMATLEVDIAISYEPPKHPDLVLAGVRKVRCGLFASRRYLAYYGKPRNMQDLVLNHRICDKGSHQTYVPGWKEVVDNARHIVYRTNSVFSLHNAVTNGIGIGILPLGNSFDNLMHLDNLSFNFDFNIYLIAHKDTKDMPRIRLVLDFAREFLQTRNAY